MKAAAKTAPAPHDPSWDIDRHVGMRLRARRTALGLTQQQLAGLIGVTYQQAQKYETGANRMTAERLLAAAQALEVGVDHFFEGVGGGPRHHVGESPAPDPLAQAIAALAQRIAREHPAVAEALRLAIDGRAPAPTERAARKALPQERAWPSLHH
jgi:transcriptional regulator with XRE-family HTH domain